MTTYVEKLICKIYSIRITLRKEKIKQTQGSAPRDIC